MILKKTQKEWQIIIYKKLQISLHFEHIISAQAQKQSFYPLPQKTVVQRSDHSCNVTLAKNVTEKEPIICCNTKKIYPTKYKPPPY